MLTIRRYEDTDRAAWDEFCKKSKSPMFIFERNFMEYHKDRFVDHSLLFYKDEKLVALLPMNESDGRLYSHAGLTYGGFITDTSMKQVLMNQCFDILIDYARKSGFRSILYKAVPHIYHEQPAEEDRYALFHCNAKIIKIEPTTVIRLDALPIKLAKLRQRQIAKALKENVIVKKLSSSEGYHTYMDIVNDVLGKYHGTKAVHSGDEMYFLYTHFPDNIHLYGGFIGEDMIGGTIVYEYGQIVHTVYLASNDFSRKIGGLDLIISTVIEEFRNRKKWYDFGISSLDGGAVLMEGLISQKEGFGGRTNVYDTWQIDI